MDKEKKSGWYYDDTILLAIIILVVFVLYSAGIAVFIAKSDDKTVGAFEAISGVSGLLLSISTVFYVIKTYTAQKEQVRIQKDLIDFQKDEINRNRRDVDFNRVLDLVYKQLEYTDKRLLKLSESHFKLLFNLVKGNAYYAESISFNWIFIKLIEEFQLYDSIIDNGHLDIYNVNLVYDVIITNINQELILLYKMYFRFLEFTIDENEIKAKYEIYLTEKFYLDKFFIPEMDDEDLDKEKRLKLILQKFNIEFQEKVKDYMTIIKNFKTLNLLVNKFEKR